MTPEDEAISDSNQTTSDSLPDTSYASIQKPEIAEGTTDQHILLWGRFWSEHQDVGVAFAINYNLDELRFRDEEFLVFDDLSKLHTFDPDQHFTRFKRPFKSDSSSASVPDATIKQVNQTFKNYLKSNQVEEELVNYLKNKNRDQFSDEAYELVHKIFTKGNVVYQFKAELSTLESSEPSQQSSNQPNGAVTQDESNQQKNEDEENETFLNVKPVTSPMNGEFPSDLNVGATVLVRTVGEVTQNLPDSLQSEDHENLSIPLDSTVRSISSEVDLPPDFDGDEKDYWELTVNFLEDHVGKTFLHKNTQVKTKNSDDGETETTFLTSPLFYIGAGLSILACVVLAVFIFGF